MKIDFSQPLHDLDGEPIEQEKGKPATLATVSVNALLAAFTDERELAGTEKVNRYEIARKINKGGVVKLTVGEANTIKTLIGKAFAPLIVGQAWPMLEGADKDE